MMRQGQAGHGGATAPAMMGDIAAAKVLDWNVEFDRGLRSGAQVEAALRLGPRLLKLSQEPVVAEITAGLFKLEPGQDQVLANAIVRRLADAFQSGSNFTRLCILKVFLLEYRGRKQSRAKGHAGLLTKGRIPNYGVPVRRLKAVLDSGDQVARALALRAIGCLADLASDSMDVHRLVLDALQSPHRQEVEGAFFAIGCLCEVSVAFSAQALEKIVDLVNAMATPPEVKRLAARIFAKMSLAPQLSLEAHEAGRKLMLRLPAEDLVKTVLLALTNLATHALEIMEQQVKVLLSYVSSDPRANVRAVALNCLIKLASQAKLSCLLTEEDFDLLSAVLCEPGPPSILHVSTFQLLRKLVPSYLATTHGSCVEELVSLSELFSLHRDWSVVQASLALLVELACSTSEHRRSLPAGTKVDSSFTQRKADTTSTDQRSIQLDLPIRVTLLLCDQVAATFLLEQPGDKHAFHGKSYQSGEPSSHERCTTLCRLLTRMVRGCPKVGFTMVDYLAGVLESLATRTSLQSMDKQLERGATDMEIDGRTMLTEGSQDKIEEIAPGEAASILPLVSILFRCLQACVTDAVEEQTYGLICSRLCSLATYLAKAEASGDLLMCLLPVAVKASINHRLKSHCNILADGKSQQFQQQDSKQQAASPTDISTEHLRMSIFKAGETMRKRSKYWALYKVGEQAAYACQWPLAESTFICLRDKVMSEGSHLWLDALAQVSGAEAILCQGRTVATADDLHGGSAEKGNDGHQAMEVDVMMSTTDCSPAKRNFLDSNQQVQRPKYHDQRNEDGGRTVYAERAVASLPLFHNAIQILGAGVCLDRSFEFQRWFLTLRRSMLQRTAELVGLVDLGTLDMMFIKQGPSPPGSLSEVEKLDSAVTASRLQAIAEKADWLASEFKRLSEEFDLLCLSFMGTNRESLQILSQASLQCSLLAFCITFALFPKVSGARPEVTSTHVDIGLAVYDLLQRLEHAYGDEWEDLTLLCLEYGAIHGTSDGLRAIYCSASHGQPLRRVCKWAVQEVVTLYQMRSKSNSLPWLQFRGLSFLKKLLDKWSALPWLLPSCFFSTRPRTGFEVLVAQLGSSEMSIREGSLLSLGLGFLVVHFPPKTRGKSLCCALTVQPAKTTVSQEEDACVGWRVGWHEGKHADQLFDVALIEELVLRERGLADKTGNGGQDSEPRCFVSVPLDESGRGFASCILDVRRLPCGVYQISTHCVCTDKKGAQWSLLPPRTFPTFKII